MRSFILSLGLISLFLSGCERDRFVIIGTPSDTIPTAQTSASQLTQNQIELSKPCLPSENEIASMPYLTAYIKVGANVALPQKAQQEKIDGCSAVRFHMGYDGLPKDVEVVRESPTGYELGQRLKMAVEASEFQMPTDRISWYYQIAVITHEGRFVRTFSGGPKHFIKNDTLSPPTTNGDKPYEK